MSKILGDSTTQQSSKGALTAGGIGFTAASGGMVTVSVAKKIASAASKSLGTGTKVGLGLGGGIAAGAALLVALAKLDNHREKKSAMDKYGLTEPISTGEPSPKKLA